jgi:transposase InsO family protein
VNSRFFAIRLLGGLGWDNAVAESSFNSLTNKLVDDADYDRNAPATASIAEYIETSYNTLGRHFYLGYNSSTEFEFKTKVA